MTESQTVKSKRAQVSDRLQKKYPDREWADDEALFGQINDDYDEYENTLKEKTAAEERLGGMFSQYPQSARFITDMANGVNPWVAMVEELGMDGITDIFENPEYKEELARAQEEHMKRLTKSHELEEEYSKNLDESLNVMKGAQEELGLSDEQIDSAVDLLMEIANDAIVGKFSRNSLELALKALNHDADIESARAEGRVGGLNEKIEAKLRKSRSGDGVPALAGSHNAPSRQRGNESIFDLADQA
ncbi:MAG: hypothetical protein HDS51_00660 [Barnesiella sp.]|nr:hypothetical protein [Barnesiella sp.]